MNSHISKALICFDFSGEFRLLEQQNVVNLFDLVIKFGPRTENSSLSASNGVYQVFVDDCTLNNCIYSESMLKLILCSFCFIWIPEISDSAMEGFEIDRFNHVFEGLALRMCFILPENTRMQLKTPYIHSFRSFSALPKTLSLFNVSSNFSIILNETMLYGLCSSLVQCAYQFFVGFYALSSLHELFIDDVSFCMILDDRTLSFLDKVLENRDFVLIRRPNVDDTNYHFEVVLASDYFFICRTDHFVFTHYDYKYEFDPEKCEFVCGKLTNVWKTSQLDFLPEGASKPPIYFMEKYLNV
ncbi:hypothetical protein PCE1_004611 [Barthelona sp. PCE]